MAGIGAEATEHLAGRGANDGTMLADIEASADESKGTHLATQPEKIGISDRSIAVPSEAGIEEIEIGRQLVRRAVATALVVQRRGQPSPDEGELAPVRFLAGARVQGRRVIIEVGLVPLDGVRQLRADRRQAGGLAEITRQRPYPVAIDGQQRAALKAQRLRQHRGVGVGIAILIASNPRPEPDRRTNRREDSWVATGQRLGQLFVDIRNRVEEGPLQVEERIADLIEHAGTDRPNLVRMPQDFDLGGNPLSHPIAFSRRQGRAKPRQLLADAVLVIKDAAPNGFGWMRGQYRSDLELLEDGRHARVGDAVLGATRHGSIELANFIAGLDDRPRLSLQLREVDELKIRGKGPHQAGGVGQRDPTKLRNQLALFRRVVALAQRLGPESNRFLELVERKPLVLAQRFTQELPEEPDLGPKAGLDQRRFGHRDAHGSQDTIGASRRVKPMPDPNGVSPLKRESTRLTEGDDRDPARAMLRAIGFSRADLAKPLIGVGHSWIETMPCNYNHRRLTEKVKAGIRTAGGTPMEFNTIAVSDGVSMGTEGMKASLVSREVIADSIELVVRGHLFDGLVMIVGCDK